MSVLFAYICTKQTSDPYIPAVIANPVIFQRNVSDAFAALQGGHFTVGQITFYPVQRSVANHLLCDGKEVARTDFPELFAYLGTSQGAPSAPTMFALPNYVASIAPATAAATSPEVVAAGTAITPSNPNTPPGAGVGEGGGGGVDSGGRGRRDPNNPIQ